MQHIARKRFGQNFLADRGVIYDIIAAIAPQHDDNMVEIGPGLGALTTPLLQRLPHLHVVEIDRDLIARLQRTFPETQLTIHAGDALQFDFNQFAHPVRVVGNLPYNISTPLLLHLLHFGQHIIDMHFMLQKEVVDRICAQPSCADYGRLSVLIQYFCEVDPLLLVPPTAFDPMPKVDSAVVRLIPRAAPVPAQNERLFQQILTAAFAQRRKTLRNNLRNYVQGDDWQALALDPQARAENLSVQDYIHISNWLHHQRGDAALIANTP